MYKLLTALLFVALTSVSAYAGPQERGMISGAAIGGTAGAVIGSQTNETAQGAIVGAMFGAIAGAILADQIHATPVRHRAQRQPVHLHKRNHHRYEKRHHWRNHRMHQRHRSDYRNYRYSRHDQRDRRHYRNHDVKSRHGHQAYRSHAEQGIDRRHYRYHGKRALNGRFNHRVGDVIRHQSYNRPHSRYFHDVMMTSDRSSSRQRRVELSEPQMILFVNLLRVNMKPNNAPAWIFSIP
jgi:uncharacterized protein YcfJ